MLKEFEVEGLLECCCCYYYDVEKLLFVIVVQLLLFDVDGDIFVKFLEWQGDGLMLCILYVVLKFDFVMVFGECMLVRLIEMWGEDYDYQVCLICRIGMVSYKIVGIYCVGVNFDVGGWIMLIDKGSDKEWQVCFGDVYGVQNGELVEVEQVGLCGCIGLFLVWVSEWLGDFFVLCVVSLIVIYQYGIFDDFFDEVMVEVDVVKFVIMKGCEDLCKLLLVIIDFLDVCDYDDVVVVEICDDGGVDIWVVIVDVVYYVCLNLVFDCEVRKCGNFSYFFDCVVLMLFDVLLGDLCLLYQGVDWLVIVVWMWLDVQGNKISYSFYCVMMYFLVSLFYEQVQVVVDGNLDDQIVLLLDVVIKLLWYVYELLKLVCVCCQLLELDLFECKIILMFDGWVKLVNFCDRFDVYWLIEEFMVLVNVVVVEELEKLCCLLLYCVYEEFSIEKLDVLCEVVEVLGFSLVKGQVLQMCYLNWFLEQVVGLDFDELINMMVLCLMQQVYYYLENYGYFGLVLWFYVYFILLIWCYFDLIVYWVLIVGYKWGDDGLL